jgi:uncharacterized protein
VRNVDPGSVPSETSPDAAEAHAASVEQWRRGRHARLVAPEGWLTLVDRILLDPGDNETPIGRVRVDGGRAFLVARSDVAVTVNGEPAAGERELHTEDGGALDRVVAAGIRYELSSIAGQLSLRVKDPESSARRGFRGLTYFPVDPAWRVTGRLEVPVAGGRGVVHFTVKGHELSLSVEKPGASRLVFVFGDETNRTDTYPGGRFLYADPPRGDEVVLDFNFAFNPPCAFTPHAICPAVLPRDRLPIAVTAGERRYDEP